MATNPGLYFQAMLTMVEYLEEQKQPLPNLFPTSSNILLCLRGHQDFVQPHYDRRAGGAHHGNLHNTSTPASPPSGRWSSRWASACSSTPWSQFQPVAVAHHLASGQNASNNQKYVFDDMVLLDGDSLRVLQRLGTITHGYNPARDRRPAKSQRA
jgi:hypothetical protein